MLDEGKKERERESERGKERERERHKSKQKDTHDAPSMSAPMVRMPHPTPRSATHLLDISSNVDEIVCSMQALQDKRKNKKKYYKVFQNGVGQNIRVHNFHLKFNNGSSIFNLFKTILFPDIQLKNPKT